MEFFSEIRADTWLTLAGGLFILLGLVFVWVTVRSVREALDSRQWPQTRATFREAEVVKLVRERSEKGNYRQYVSYLCELTYEYRVAGQGLTARVRTRAENREHAARIAASHQAREPRWIHYNPDRPERYRFELESPFVGLIWLLPCAAFAGFGWAVIYAAKHFYGQ